MSKGLNACQFIGNLGVDPEMRYTPSGAAVANFRIGCSESWMDKQSGERQERTEWVRCVAFGKLAEVCGEYLHKGSRVYVSGRMKTDKYQAQDGSDRYSTSIVVGDMIMLDGKSEPRQQSKPQQAEPADDFDQDIPF